MAGKSKTLQISKSSSPVVTFTKGEIKSLLQKASDRTRLYILLMLNCGMTQKDISDLDVTEVDWDAGRVTRKRSKTKGFENVPIVRYPLWSETLDLLRQECSGADAGSVLLNSKGNPLIYSEVGADNRLKRNDNVRSAYERVTRSVGIKKPLKCLKKTSASLIRDNPRYASLEDLFLGHAPRRMSDKHYTSVPYSLFDEAIAWLGSELEISAALADGE
jgi:integrase